MAEQAKASHPKTGEAEKEHRVRHQEPQTSLDKFHGWETNIFPLGETPFLPPMDEHAALLRAAHSGEGRTNLVLHLQRTYGNRYVQRLLNSKAVQAKLTVNAPGDIYEQEADRVADLVTRAVTSKTQRQVEDEEEEEEEVQTQRQVEEEEEEVQAKLVQRQVEEEEEEVQAQSNQPTTASENLETRINNAWGSGHPLSDDVREPMEQALGADFGGVRVHTDSQADLLSQELSARAFTTAHDIFFRQGEYSPGSESGRRLIAHELTHVVQQTGGVGRTDIKVKSAKPLEHVAEEEVIQQAIDPVKVADYEQVLGLEKVKIVEVENNKDINALTEFSNYKAESKFNLEVQDEALSCVTLHIPPETVGQFTDEDQEFYQKMKAYDFVQYYMGKGGYSERGDMIVLPENPDDRTLFHEMGHKSQRELNFAQSNTEVIVLEYHNILANENYLEGQMRVSYIPDNAKQQSMKNWQALRESAESLPDKPRTITALDEIERLLTDVDKYAPHADEIKRNLINEFFVKNPPQLGS